MPNAPNVRAIRERTIAKHSQMEFRMADIPSFKSYVPGFDFLQGLVQNAGSALPGIGQWVAPTLDPAELDKRIQELRTVQFWLEQNARMLGATIQALEVQKMTLSTLQTMNVQMSDLRESLTIRPKADAPVSEAPAFGWATPPKAAPEPAAAEPASPAAPAAGPHAKAQTVDPMQWWGALTRQFGELATNALKEGPVGLGGAPAGAFAAADLGLGAMAKAATDMLNPAAKTSAPAGATLGAASTRAKPATTVRKASATGAASTPAKRTPKKGTPAKGALASRKPVR
jgi:hypothetical protein